MKKIRDFIDTPKDIQTETDGIIKSRFKIAKSDDDKMLAFGWASIAVRADGEVIEDWQEDIIEPEVLEEAAYLTDPPKMVYRSTKTIFRKHQNKIYKK